MNDCLTLWGNSGNQTWYYSSNTGNAPEYPDCDDGQYFVSDTAPALGNGTVSGDVTLTTGFTIEETMEATYAIMMALAVALSFKFIKKMMGF